MKSALLVAAGGALGTLCRYLVGLGVLRWLPGRMPLATLVVNVLGSFAIGIVIAFYSTRGQFDSVTRIALTTGVLGGFTTYSAFAYEVVSLAREREIAVLALYLGALFALSLLGCVAGIALGRALAS